MTTAEPTSLSGTPQIAQDVLDALGQPEVPQDRPTSTQGLSEPT